MEPEEARDTIAKLIPEEHQLDNTKHLSATDLLNLDIPPIEWYINSLIPQKGVIIFGGDSGSLKSYAALDLARCLATNKNYLGHFKTKNIDDRPILYLDEENRKITVKDRLRLLVKEEAQDTLGDLIFMIEPNLRIDDVNSFKWFKQYLIDKELSPQVIIFDSFIRFFSGDENFSGEVKKVFEGIKELMKEHDCTVIILHHTRKDGGTGKHSLRGSGDLSAFADSILMFRKKSSEEYHVQQVKNRHTEEHPTFSIKPEFYIDKTVLAYGEEVSTSQTSVNECCEVIKQWVATNNIETFKTKQCEDKVAAHGHSRTTMYESLKKLKDSYIKWVKKGEYRVIRNPDQDTLEVEEENV